MDDENMEDVEGHQLMARTEPTERELQRRYDALGERLTAASHDLKHPLTALWLQIQVLQRQARMVEVVPSEAVLAALDRMDRQIRRLTGVIESLQDVGVSSRGLMPRRETLDMVALVHTVVDRMETQIKNSGSSVTLSGGRPACGEWDRAYLETAIRNLMSNALTYGAGQPIEIDITDEDETVRVSIRNGGPGIAPKDQARIFQRFEHVGGDSGPRGLGIGLAIIQSIAEAHGGTIRVESSAETGTRFILELPKQG